jgi:hypothetical protein
LHTVHCLFSWRLIQIESIGDQLAFTGDDNMVSNVAEIRKQAQEQKSQNNWADAITLYEKIYSPQCDRWLAWEYADCLKKFSRIDEAISVSKNLYQRDKQFIHNNNFLSWLLYEKYFKHPQAEYNFQELNHLYEIALSITTFTAQDGKGAYEITIIQMLKLLKKHGNNPASKILALLEKLDVQKLSDKAGTYEQRGREKEYQSPKEMFYAMKTKALLDSKCYDECISCCDEALLSLEHFHHDNKSWIIARKAVSMAQSGNPNEGIVELKKALLHKSHWSLLENIAEIYLIKQEPLNALLYFSMASISYDPPKMKVTLYLNIANLLYSMGDYENAWKHLCYAKGIREKEQWNIPASMQQLQMKLSVYKFSDDIQFYQLKEFWLQTIYAKLGTHNGVINRINAGGKTGFILCNGKSYFFKGQSFVERPNFKEHDKVIFCLVESFDAKKQRQSLECEYIKFDKQQS